MSYRSKFCVCLEAVSRPGFMARTAPRMRPQIAPRDAPNTVGESPGVREVPLVGLTAAVSFLRSARAAARMGVRPGIHRSALLWTPKPVWTRRASGKGREVLIRRSAAPVRWPGWETECCHMAQINIPNRTHWKARVAQ